MKLAKFAALTALALTVQAGTAHACAKEDARNLTAKSRASAVRMAADLLGPKAPGKTTATTSDASA